MIREIHIFKDGQTLFQDIIVPNKDLDTSAVMMLVASSAQKLQEWKIDSMEIERFRYVYMNSHNTQFIVTLDRQASLQKVNEAMMDLVSKFMTVFESSLESNEWKSTDFTLWCWLQRGCWEDSSEDVSSWTRWNWKDNST